MLIRCRPNNLAGRMGTPLEQTREPEQVLTNLAVRQPTTIHMERGVAHDCKVPSEPGRGAMMVDP